MTGQVQTVTVSPTENTSSATSGSSIAASASPSSASSNTNISAHDDGNKNHKSFWDKKGAVAGVFVVVALVALALLALLAFCCFRRRKQQRETGQNSPSGSVDKSGFGIGRSPTLAGAALGGANIKRDQSTSTTLAGYGFDEKNGRFDNGQSIVPVVDQRLDPTQIFMRWDENDSRRSLADEHDYSRRVLRVANPSRNSYEST